MEGESQKSVLEPEKANILKSLDGRGKRTNLFIILASFLVVALGVASGWFLSGGVLGETNTEQGVVSENVVKSENEAGIEDESIFPHTAEGTLLEGGTETEGTHHLERTGGPSQNVYLTSTVIDLQSFVGKKVKVWGQTITGQKSGWMMEVGKIKVIE